VSSCLHGPIWYTPKTHPLNSTRADLQLLSVLITQRLFGATDATGFSESEHILCSDVSSGLSCIHPPPTRGQDGVYHHFIWPLTITIPAVKIPDAMPAFPFLPPSDDLLLPPETCLSLSTGIKLERIDSSLFPAKAEPLPTLLSDEENEDEFGEFLLDAVQWL
jgi:hypothetical protein